MYHNMLHTGIADANDTSMYTLLKTNNKQPIKTKIKWT